MPPSKAARGGQDDSKIDNLPTAKEKNGSGGGTKMRRVASSAGSNLREVTNASSTATAIATVPDAAANAQEASAPGVGGASTFRSDFCSSSSRCTR